MDLKRQLTGQTTFAWVPIELTGSGVLTEIGVRPMPHHGAGTALRTLTHAIRSSKNVILRYDLSTRINFKSLP